MKKRTLKEEIERIHTITYGKKVLLEDDTLNKILQGTEPINTQTYDDPQKADFVEDDVNKFFTDLKSIDHEVSEQKFGSMEYQKEVELIQIGLVLLGYDLPEHGIDGYFDPETAAAVRKYKTENSVLNESLIPGIDEMVWNKMPWGINDGEKVDGIKWKNHDTHIHFGFTNVDVAVKVIEKALSLGLHAGENPYTSKVYPVHVSDSHHYETFSQTVNGKKVGGGLDVSGDKSKMEELFNWASTELGGGESVSISSISQTDSETDTQMETVSPEMIKSMVSKLETKGVTKEELDNLVDKVTTGGSDIFTDLDLTTNEGYSKYAKICDLYIKTRTPNPLGITGTMLADGAQMAFTRHNKYIPPELALAQLAAEGGIGDPNTGNIPVSTKNPFNVGNVDNGSTKTFATIQDAIDGYYSLIARSYLGKGKTANNLISNFVNGRNERYAKEEDYEDVVTSIAKQVKKIAKTV
jgi:hypothetical protein